MDTVDTAKSDSLDILSPKNAPQSTAPIVIPDGIPRLMDMPMKAIPSVPHVVQEDPVTVDMAAHTRSTRGRNRCGSISLSP